MLLDERVVTDPEAFWDALQTQTYAKLIEYVMDVQDALITILSEKTLPIAELGTEVEIFTRATSSDIPPIAELAPGVLVRNVVAGPFDVPERELSATIARVMQASRASATVH